MSELTKTYLCEKCGNQTFEQYRTCLKCGHIDYTIEPNLEKCFCDSEEIDISMQICPCCKGYDGHIFHKDKS